MSLKVLVNAQSMIRPLICVPKSNLMTSSLSMTVVSPPLGVQCAAMWFCEQPVGNAIPASSPRAWMSCRTESSSVSHTSMSFMPGFTQLSMYFLTSLCTSAHCRTSLYMFFSRRSSSRFSSDVSRHRLSSLYDWISPSGKTSLKRTDTGTDGGEVWPAAPDPGAPPPPAFFFFFFFFFFLAPAAAAASPPSSASSPDSAAATSSTLSFSSICAAASAASSAMTRGSEPVAVAQAERDGGGVTSRRRSRASGCAEWRRRTRTCRQHRICGTEQRRRGFGGDFDTYAFDQWAECCANRYVHIRLRQRKPARAIPFLVPPRVP